MNEHNIAVTGDEEFDRPRLLTTTLNKFGHDFIVHTRGHANVTRKKKVYHEGKKKTKGVGAELLANRWAVLMGHGTFTHGRKGVTRKFLYRQLKRMFRASDEVIIFWNGFDRETKEIIRVAKKIFEDECIHVIRYKQPIQDLRWSCPKITEQ